MREVFAAVDLGASSGRVAVGTWSGDGLSVEIVHRFENRPTSAGGRLVWDDEALYLETLVGLREAVARAKLLGVNMSGIGIDCWGVDYTLVNQIDRGPVAHYRDPTGVSLSVAEREISEMEAFSLTGVRDQPINTSTRLSKDPGRVEGARLLFVADLWIKRLTGSIGTEPTIASTSQLLGARSDRWSSAMLRVHDIPPEMMPVVQKTGSRAGMTTPETTGQIGADTAIPVYRVGEHDTASAFAFAKPLSAGDRGTALISSGTWSLVGLPLNEPSTDSATLAAGFTNERGVGTYLLLRNLNGMWLLQEGLREWSVRNPSLPPIEELIARAERLPPGKSAIDISDDRLLNPSSMLEVIGQLADECGTPRPETPEALVRVVCDGLSTVYADTVRLLSAHTGVKVDAIRIVGGGARNRLLCQRTADVSSLPVKAGPIEASVLGNLACQIHASGLTASIQDVYASVSADPTTTYRPQAIAANFNEKS